MNTKFHQHVIPTLSKRINLHMVNVVTNIAFLHIFHNKRMLCIKGPISLDVYVESTCKTPCIYIEMHSTTSHIYMLHEVIPNLCEICYFMSLYHLNTNVMHYLNTKVMCTTFMCKQHE